MAEEAVGALGGPGYTLLTSERAAEAAPEIVGMAGQTHYVGPGLVDELAGDLLEEDVGLAGDRFVALGGGRIVDVAKALAAANRLGLGAGAKEARAMAVPTTLSGAEMTVVHRHARGVEPMAPRVRPAVVVNDPSLSASQPVADLAASALNALGHAVEGPCTVMANPVATLAGRRAAALIAQAFANGDEPDREALALASLLAGYAIDSQWYGLHHVMSQTLVRVGGAGHGPANAVMLQHTIGALAARFPERHEELRVAMDNDPTATAKRVCALTGATTLREIGVDRDALAACADAAASRAELDMTPPRAERDELLALYEAAF